MLQNNVEVGGIEPAFTVFILAGQIMLAQVTGCFIRTFGDPLQPQKTGKPRPRRALMPSLCPVLALLVPVAGACVRTQ
jgi:hypothetical protein